MAEQIPAIRSDLEIEDRVPWKDFTDRRADAGVWRENQQTFRVFGDREFFRAAKHALALDAAQFADLDFEISGQHRARERERHFVADLIVLRPANNLPERSRAIIDLANAESIGIRMLHGLTDFR